MDEEKLISLVQKYKDVYDFSDTNYHNHQRKENIWEEISEELNRPVSECKKRWSTLRDSYRKSIKSQETRSGEAATKKKQWRYDKQMSFLRPFLADRKQISNVDYSDSEIETQEQDVHTEEDNYGDDNNSSVSITSCSSTPTPCSATSNKPQTSAQRKSKSRPKKNTLSSAEVLQNYLNEKDRRRKPGQETSNRTDPITKFFDCMAETVKTLSPQLQIEVKSKIFGIVTDAETRNLHFRPTASQETSLPNQLSQFTNLNQQNCVTLSQTQFPQQSYEFPYHQNQTKHNSAIPHTLYSQPQPQCPSLYPTPLPSNSNEVIEDNTNQPY